MDGRERGGKVIRLPGASDPFVRGLLEMNPAEAAPRARRHGARKVRRELCRMLAEEPGLDAGELEEIRQLLRWIGLGTEVDALCALAAATERPDDRRQVARRLLEEGAPERVGENDPAGLYFALLADTLLGALSEPRAAAAIPPFLEAWPAELREKAFGHVEAERQRYGVPAWEIHGALLAAPALAPLHLRSVVAALGEAGPETVAMLKRVAGGLTGEAATAAHRGLVRLANGLPALPPTADDEPDDDERGQACEASVRLDVTPADGAGDVVLSASITADEQRSTEAWLVLRLGGVVRAGGYAARLSYEEHEAQADESYGDRGSHGRWMANGPGARLAMEAVARTDVAGLPAAAQRAIGVFRREAERWTFVAQPPPRWLSDPIEEEPYLDDEASVETWRLMLEHRFHVAWQLDRGDLRAAGLERPTAPALGLRAPTRAETAVEVPSFDRGRFDAHLMRRTCAEVPEAWLARATARVAGSPVPARLVRMLRFTAVLLDAEPRPKRAELFRQEAARVEADFASSTCVRVVLERSAIVDLRFDRFEPSDGFLGHGASRRLLFASLPETRLTRRDLAGVDVGEAALIGLRSATEAHLFAEDRPTQSALVAVARALGLAAFDSPTTFDELVVRRLLVESGHYGDAAAAVLAPSVRERVARFLERVCGACPERCRSRPESSAGRRLETLRHPAPREAIESWYPRGEVWADLDET